MSDIDKFSGDMSRNEVEIDLKKFMAMVSEIGELKQEIFELTPTAEAPDILVSPFGHDGFLVEVESVGLDA